MGGISTKILRKSWRPSRLFDNVDLAREEGEESDEDFMNDNLMDGEVIREVLLDHFINDDSVPWQWERAHLL